MASSGGSLNLIILMPVYNDWTAFCLVMASIGEVMRANERTVRILAIDDGSTEVYPEQGIAIPASVVELHILRLRRNVGHQRAIAVGLAYIEDKLDYDAVVIMDSDGEDAVGDIPKLIVAYYASGRRSIVFAERTRRSEGWIFWFFYHLYRWLHLLLTGVSVRVGNFSIVPRVRVASLVVVSELWNHYAAAAFASRQPYVTIPTQRGKRVAGHGKMNFVGLVTHGLSAISVFGDIVGVRLLVLASFFVATSVLGIGIAVGIRLMTTWAIPGWTTYTVGMFLVMLLQGVAFLVLFSLLVLGTRHITGFLPLRDYGYFVSGIRKIESQA